MARKPAIQLQGGRQLEVMRALWSLEAAGRVEDVRQALPARRRGAYTTVQTILNRLAERGLIERTRKGRAILYEPTISEADYYSASVRQTLATASADARRSALAALVAGMAPGERDEIEALAQEVAARRDERRRT